MGGARRTPPVIALDTNVLVRLIMRDDEVQFGLARALLDRGRVFVSLSSLMEAEWVLRKRYGLRPHAIVTAFRDVLALEQVVVELEDLASWALDRTELGADYADMVLLVAARHAELFATFDRRIERDAGKDTPVRIEALC